MANEIQSQKHEPVSCKYCQSDNVIKYGKYKDVQYYWCKDCKHKFSNPNAIPKMQIPTKLIADVLNMYYEGLSEAKIRRNLIQQDNCHVSTGSIYNWVNRFTDLAVKESKKYRPDVGSVWVADETVIDLDGKNVWFWDLIDSKTRYLISSHMSYTRTTKDAQELMKRAYYRTGKIPRVIYTDKLRAYLDGIELTFGAFTKHKQGSPFNVESNTNLIERFHSTIKNRTKVIRGLHTLESARRFMTGWLVHYNFFRPHMSLKDRTPASVAGIRFPFRNWKDVIEQPYDITARIPIEQIADTPEFESKPVKVKVKRHKTAKSRIRRIPVTPSLSGIRFKR